MKLVAVGKKTAYENFTLQTYLNNIKKINRFGNSII
jgi:hypothetical protein